MVGGGGNRDLMFFHRKSHDDGREVVRYNALWLLPFGRKNSSVAFLKGTVSWYGASLGGTLCNTSKT
jgi:hypothetical protein